MAKKTEIQDNINIYFRAVVAYLVITAAAIGIFFFHVDEVIQTNVRDSVAENVRVQNSHFRSVMETQYQYLESAADYMVKQEKLNGEENTELLRSLQMGVTIKRAAFVDPRGRVFYDNGEKGSVLSRDYFADLMKGRRILNTSLKHEKDCESRMIIGVPILKEKQVLGALCATYDLDVLGGMLDSNSYDGEGDTLIVDRQGRLIASDKESIEREFVGKTIFEWLSDNKSLENKTVKDIRQDFEQSRRNRLEIRENDVDRWYMEYTPAGYNDWMLCYFVPARKAEAKYSRLKKYEIVLAAVLIVSMVVLFSILYYRSSRNMENMSRLARIDGLSGVLNKTCMEESVAAWLEDPDCRDVQAFLMIDVDNFKQINDEYGHHAGDIVIRQVGNCLRNFFREDDIIGRVGGDEFVVLMKNMPARQAAYERANEILENFRKLKLPQLGIGEVTCSMGMAFYPYNGSNYNELYEKADMALYRTKQNGKNGLTVFKE